MQHMLIRTAFAAAIIGAPTAAEATDVVFNGSMTGTSIVVPAPTGCSLFGSTLTGTGSSSLGPFSYSHTVCLAGPGPIVGDFLLDFSGGDTLFGTIAGAAATTATPGLFDLSLGYTIAGGAGQFDGASGAFQGIGYVDQRTQGITSVGMNFSAVPEPGTWTMILLGFGALGASLRRRRSVAAAPRLRSA